MNGSVNNQNNNVPNGFNTYNSTNNGLNNNPMPPTYGSTPSTNPVPPVYGSVPSNNPVPPVYGSTPSNNTVPPVYGSTPNNNTVPPVYGGTPSNNLVPPVYGSTPSTNPVPPVYGSAPSTNPVPPTYGSVPSNNQVPPTYGNMPNYNQAPMGQTPYYGYNQQNNMGNKKKSSAGLVALIIVAVVVVGFIFLHFGSNKTSVSKPGPHTTTDYERTIMIYMVGSDLESSYGFGSVDLNSLDYNSFKNENTKVILIAGGSNNWFNTYVDVDSTSIYELTESGFKIVKKQSRKNMGDAAVLTDFLNYGFDNYKSKKYDLVFWNHGLGVLGSESDQLNNGDFLTLSEMNTAFSNSRFGENNKLELVLFRTCLNGTIEVADTLKKYSDYMVASEEITNAYGTSPFLKYLNTVKKTDDAQSFGKKYADGYKEYIETYNATRVDKIVYTYSVIDLSKVDQLEKSLNDFFGDIDLSKNYNSVARVRANLRQYGSEDLTYDSVDLYTLINNLKYLSPTKGQKVLDDINSCVIYNKTNEINSKGLSVYFPYNGDLQSRRTILSKYYNFNSLSKYKTFITSLTDMQASGTTSTSFLNNNVNLNNSANSSADFSIELTAEQKENYSKAGYIVFRDNKDGTYLPVYYSGSVKLDGNTLSANIKGRQLKVIDKSSKEESLMTLVEVEETDDYIKYETNGILEHISSTDLNSWKMHSAKINLILDKKTNKISLGNIYIRPQSKENSFDKSGVNEPYTVIADLKEYTHIAIGSSSYKILDDKGNFTEDWTSNGIYKGLEVEPENITFGLEDYTSGYEYYAVFKLVDVNKNVSYSKLVKMK